MAPNMLSVVTQCKVQQYNRLILLVETRHFGFRRSKVLADGGTAAMKTVKGARTTDASIEKVNHVIRRNVFKSCLQFAEPPPKGADHLTVRFIAAPFGAAL
eukprot:scaffold4200_cov164-Amphora_coffeaeformis.AAC.4